MSSPDQSAAVAMVMAADLGCALCRKRTGEPVTRLCHACGLPVHLTCAQHVAARECDLEFGFPLPSVYCSKRCYDATDLLGPDDLSTADATRRSSVQVPNEVTAALTLKIGDVSRTSRKHLSITTFRFLLSEGFDVFKAKVNSRAAKELQAYTLEPYVREDPAIYIRPGVHSKQAELVELTDKNFETRIRKTFRNFLKRKATQSAGAAGLRQEQFECDIYAYVKKESVVRRRSVASNRDTVATANVHGGGVKMLSGLAAQHQLMLQQPPPGPLRVSPTGDVVEGNDVSGTGDGSLLDAAGTKRRLSELQDRTELLTEDPPGYKSIRMILNGSVVAVKVNVADLVNALGQSNALLSMATSQSDNEGGGVSGSSVNGEC